MLKVGIAWAGILLLVAACGQPAALPPTTQPPSTLVPSPASQPTPRPPDIAHGLYSDYGLVLQADTWVAQSPSGEVAASWNNQEKYWEYNFEELAKDERINIFDANSFPNRFRYIVQNPETVKAASLEDLRMYQEFVEAVRAEFFEQEGISHEVANIRGVNEELKSLWGTIYWAQNNRDQVIADKLRPVVTPLELIAINNEPGVQDWQDKRSVTGGEVSLFYGRSITGKISGFSEYAGKTYLLGREGEVLQYPDNSAAGIAALRTRLFSEDSASTIEIMAMNMSPEQEALHRHVLFAGAAGSSETYTLSAGSICIAARSGENFQPQEIQNDLAVGMPGSEDELWEALGANVFFVHNMDVGGGLAASACFDPETGLGVVTFLREFRSADRVVELFPGSWPWQQ